MQSDLRQLFRKKRFRSKIWSRIRPEKKKVDRDFGALAVSMSELRETKNLTWGVGAESVFYLDL